MLLQFVKYFLLTKEVQILADGEEITNEKKASVDDLDNFEWEILEEKILNEMYKR